MRIIAGLTAYTTSPTPCLSIRFPTSCLAIFLRLIISAYPRYSCPLACEKFWSVRLRVGDPCMIYVHDKSRCLSTDSTNIHFGPWFGHFRSAFYVKCRPLPAPKRLDPFMHVLCVKLEIPISYRFRESCPHERAAESKASLQTLTANTRLHVARLHP